MSDVFVIQKDQYRQRDSSKDPRYEDKAEKRRQAHGLDLPGIPDAPAASVDAAIPSQNKGHKLLQKMGWKAGQSLGKTETGISEPVRIFELFPSKTFWYTISCCPKITRNIFNIPKILSCFLNYSSDWHKSYYISNCYYAVPFCPITIATGVSCLIFVDKKLM